MSSLVLKRVTIPFLLDRTQFISFLKSLTDHLKILRNYHAEKKFKSALLPRFSLKKVGIILDGDNTELFSTCHLLMLCFCLFNL